MSRLNPAAVMSSFVGKVRNSIRNWRSKKHSEVFEDVSDQLFIESLEERVLLDGSMPGEEDFQTSEETAWFALPSDAAIAVANYFNSEAVNGSSSVWRPIEQIRQADPDPATGQVSQEQIDELDLSRLVGADSRTVLDNTSLDVYEIDDSLWTGLDITTEVKSFAQDDGSYIVVLKRTERDRSFDLGSSGGGAPGGPGSPGGGGSNPYEQVDSDISTTIVQTDDANVVSQIETNQTIDTTAFDRWLSIETDFTFRYEILSDDGFGQREFSVTTDYEIDLDVHWMGLYEHTIVDEAGDGTSGDSIDQLPLGETDITIDYDLIVDADFEGNQSYEATAQLGPGNIGSATFENSGLASGTYSVTSETTSTDLYTRGDLDYDAGQFGIRLEVNNTDDLVLNSTSSFSYVGSGTNTHGSTDASFTSGQYDITTSRITTINDQSETEFFYESYLDESESSEADAQAEADAADENTGEDTPDTGSDDTTNNYYIPTTTHTHTKNYWKVIPANVGSSQSTTNLTIHYANGEQGLTQLDSTESSSYDTTGDFYQSSSYQSVFSKDGSSASYLSTSDSLLSSDEWVGTTSSQSDLTFTPDAEGEFVITGFIDDQSSYTSGLASSTVGTALVLASVSAALRNDEEETTEGGASDPGSSSTTNDDSASLPVSAENYLTNHLTLGFSATGSTDPDLHEDLSIRYNYNKTTSSDSSNTQYSAGHNNIRTELDDADTMRLISSESESYQVLSQGGTSSFISDSIVTDGDYTNENGSFYRDHSSTSSNWHIDDEVVSSSSDLTSVVDAIEIVAPDGTTDGSGSSDPNSGSSGGSAEDDSPATYKTNETTVGTISYEQTLTGEYSYSETESSSEIIVDQRNEQEGGDWTHEEIQNSASNSSESTTDGDSWSKQEVQHFGDVSGGIPIEGRGQSIWQRNQADSDSVTTDSSETEYSNSYRYRTHSGGQSLGEGTGLPGGGGSVQSATATSDTQESSSSKLTAGSTSTVLVDEDLYTLTHRLLDNSGSGGTGGPGGTGGGAPGSGGTTSGPTPIEGPTFTYTTSSADGDKTEVTLGGHSDVSVTTNSWNNLGDIQSKLSMGDTYSDEQGDLGNDLVFQSGIAPDGTLIVGPDAPNISSTSSSNLVHKVYFADDGRYDVIDGTETYSKTTKNKRILEMEDSRSDATEDLPYSTRVTTFEILDNNAETSTRTVTSTDTYENFGTRTQLVEKLFSDNSAADTSGEGEENTTLDPNDWLSQSFGVEVNSYGTGSRTAETRVHGSSNSSIQTRETIVDTQKDGSGDATRITTKTSTADKTFDQTDTTRKTFDQYGNLEIEVTKEALAGNNRIEKYQLIEDEFTASYTKTESDGGVLEITRTGDSTSTTNEEFERSVSGSLIYNVLYDGTAQSVSGAIVTTFTGNGDSVADDTQTVEKTKTYIGTFSSGDLDPGIVNGHVPQSIQGGGTETGTIEYTIKKTEIQKLADNFDGTMTSTFTGSINSDGEFESDISKDYTSTIDGTKETRTIAENNYQAFGNLGGTPTIDTGLVLVDSYSYTISDDNFSTHEKLGFSVSNGYGSYNFVGTPIDAEIGDTFASIPEADNSYESVTTETTYTSPGETEDSASTSDEDVGSSYFTSLQPIVGTYSGSIQEKEKTKPKLITKGKYKGFYRNKKGQLVDINGIRMGTNGLPLSSMSTTARKIKLANAKKIRAKQIAARKALQKAAQAQALIDRAKIKKKEQTIDEKFLEELIKTYKEKYSDKDSLELINLYQIAEGKIELKDVSGIAWWFGYDLYYGRTRTIESDVITIDPDTIGADLSEDSLGNLEEGAEILRIALGRLAATKGSVLYQRLQEMELVHLTDPKKLLDALEKNNIPLFAGLLRGATVEDFHQLDRRVVTILSVIPPFTIYISAVELTSGHSFSFTGREEKLSGWGYAGATLGVFGGFGTLILASVFSRGKGLFRILGVADDYADDVGRVTNVSTGGVEGPLKSRISTTYGGPINNLVPELLSGDKNCVQCVMAILHNKLPKNFKRRDWIGANGAKGVSGRYGQTWEVDIWGSKGTLNTTQALDYIEEGLGLVVQKTIKGNFFKNATEPGHYVIMNSKHIVYGRVIPSGKIFAYDGQTNSIFTSWAELEKAFPPSKDKIISYLLR